MRTVVLPDIGKGSVSYDPFGGPSEFRRTTRSLVPGSIVGEYVGSVAKAALPDYSGAWPPPVVVPPDEGPSLRERAISIRGDLDRLIADL